MSWAFRAMLHCTCNLAEFSSDSGIASPKKPASMMPERQVQSLEGVHMLASEKSCSFGSKYLRTVAGNAELANWMHGHSSLVTGSWLM